MRRKNSPLIPSTKRKRLLLLLPLLAVVAGVALLRTGPAHMLQRAQATWHSDPTAADQFLQRSIELSGGDFPQAQVLRCRVLGLLGRWTEALGCFSLIREPTRCDQQDLIELASDARRAEQPLLAGMALEAANHPGPQQQTVLHDLISLEWRQGPDEKLRRHCQELKSLAPDDAFPWHVEAELLHRQKDLLPAIAAYREALRLTTDPAAARALRSDLVGLLIDAGDLSSARAELETLLAAGKPTPELLVKNAYLLRLQGKPAEALTEVERSLSASPSAAARMLRGVVYLDLARYEEAIDDLLEVVAEQPSNKEAHYKLSQAYLRLGKRDKADHHLNESQRLTREALENLGAASR